jgi:hypothetical protein
MRSSHLVGVFAVVALFVCTPLANAAPIISVDDFATAFTGGNAGGGTTLFVTNPGEIDESDPQSGAGILGTRVGGVHQTALLGSLSVEISGGNFIVGNVDAEGRVRLGYKFAAEDLSANSSITLPVVDVDDEGSVIEATAILRDSLGGISTNEEPLTDALNGGFLTFNLADFVGGADLTDIVFLGFTFNLTDDQDFTLSGEPGIEIQNGIPEPTSLLLCGMITALGGGWYARRKLKMSAA